jgi:hypothetical protein
VNEYALHAAGHCRPDLPKGAAFAASALRPIWERDRAVLLENLGLPGCPVCVAAWVRRAWQVEPKVVTA